LNGLRVITIFAADTHPTKGIWLPWSSGSFQRRTRRHKGAPRPRGRPLEPECQTGSVHGSAVWRPRTPTFMALRRHAYRRPCPPNPYRRRSRFNIYYRSSGCAVFLTIPFSDDSKIPQFITLFSFSSWSPSFDRRSSSAKKFSVFIS
jgi:hypothetical protein